MSSLSALTSSLEVCKKNKNKNKNNRFGLCLFVRSDGKRLFLFGVSDVGSRWFNL